ncbi:MAG: hypothetical protein AAGA03_19805, partial [Planctomycetota bacterium]
MSSPVDGPSSASLLPPIRPSEPLDQIPAWRLSGNRWLARRHSTRFKLLIAGLVSLSLLTGVLAWATTRVGPAPQIAITLAGCDYRQNLDLPINAFGDRAVGRLAAWASRDDRTGRRQVLLSSRPINLQHAADFQIVRSDSDAAVSIVFISAHGVHSPSGPVLLPGDTQSIDDGIPVRELIRQLATLPAGQRKVLLLDSVHFVSSPQHGVVLNDFARQMRSLSSEVAAVPNLVVALSSDMNQKSWIHPADGTTNWSQAFLSALNGDAKDTDRDGWIDFAEIHDAASTRCNDWAQRICGATQTPVLLPLGDEGLRRSRDCALFPTKTDAVQVPSLVEPIRDDLLAHWWQRYSEIESHEVAPRVTNPVQWRHFEETLLRMEQFELAGCRDAADELVTEL